MFRDLSGDLLIPPAPSRLGPEPVTAAAVWNTRSIASDDPAKTTAFQDSPARQQRSYRGRARRFFHLVRWPLSDVDSRGPALIL